MPQASEEGVLWKDYIDRKVVQEAMPFPFAGQALGRRDKPSILVDYGERIFRLGTMMKDDCPGQTDWDCRPVFFRDGLYDTLIYTMKSLILAQDER